ncbi:hypothetical protein BDN72DRAFT_920826, partial [Pluteus cervinus]
MSRTPGELPYTPDDLNGLIKHQLANLIRRQPDKWPLSSAFIASKMRRDEMATLLLNTEYGFTKINVESGPAQHENNNRSGLTSLSSPPPSTTQGVSQVPGPVVETERAQDPEMGQARDLQPHPVTVPAVNRDHGKNSVLAPMCQLSVSVYIEDHRTTPHDKRVFKTNLSRAAAKISKDPGQDEVFVYARDVVKELFEHESSKMRGSLEVGCPDPQDHDFIEYFYKFDDIGISPIDRQHLNPELLLVDPKDRLYVHIKPSFPLSTTGQEVNDSVSRDCSNHELPGDLKPLEVVRARATSKNHRSQNRGQLYSAKKGEMAIWLRDEAESKTEYGRFKSSFHHTLQNSEVVFTWRFAADFYHLHNKTMFTSQLPSTSTRPSRVQITRKAIQSALGVGETWLTEAIRAVEILDRYGPGGTSPSPGVVQELAAVHTPPRGRAHLLQSLYLADENNGNV